MENSTGLKSSLKTRHIVMLSLGGAIGSGLFLGSGKVIAQAKCITLIHLSWTDTLCCHVWCWENGHPSR